MIMKLTNSAKAIAITIAALALGSSPWAMAEEHGCSEANLRGTWAYTSLGTIVSAPIAVLVGPYAEVGTMYFDGKGNITFTFNSSANGNISSATENGGYKVDEDCTGTFTQINPEHTSTFNFVLDKRGEELQAICQDSGVVVTRRGERKY
jgi:hypothetical protein